VQASLYENAKRSEFAKTVPMNADPILDTTGIRSLNYPSQPLGYDRYGNAYWILDAQHMSTLFAFMPNCSATLIGETQLYSAANMTMPVEPCVLMRERSGWWGYHSGNDLSALLTSFSGDIICERILILKMIERLSYARLFLHRRPFTVKAFQKEWISHRCRAALAVHSLKMPADLTMQQQNRVKEMFWARCAEARFYIHIACMYKNEDDIPMGMSARAEKDHLLRKQKKVRDMLVDSSFNVDPFLGWNPTCHAMTSLKQVAATTTVARILADPTCYPELVSVLQRSKVLVRNDPMAGHEPIAEAAASSATVAVSAPLVPALTAGPTSATATDASTGVAVAAPAAAGDGASVPMEEEQDAPAPAVAPAQASTAVVVPPSPAKATAEAPAVVASPPAKKAASPAPVAAPVTAVKSPVKGEAPPALVAASAPGEEKEKEESAESKMEVDETASEKPAAAVSATVATADAESKKVPTDPNKVYTAEELDAMNIADYKVNLRELINSTYHNYNAKTKAIEMLHVVTDELVRIFPSGKDAAQFWAVSQSGISLCLHDVKPDFLGFKWRNYNGNAINCKSFFFFF
jgi:hypothetical protein